jgi:methylenetetrahydrofolate--tRNA-(uracil-5-)-methyltransferase
MAVYVIGAGFAGCEAAYQLALRGVLVKLVDMKPEKFTPAHKSSLFCELVCSNSFKSSDVNTASGLLKEELRQLGSVVMKAADNCSVPAGGALAVDRDLFAGYVTETLRSMENVQILSRTVVSIEEIASLPDAEALIIATGPLTDEKLSEDIIRRLGEGTLSFFDAAAPLIYKDSIDFDKAFYASRYGKGDSDYINCPMNDTEYVTFYKALLSAQYAQVKDFDDECVYEGCMPVEVMAQRGYNTLRFGPLKPVGITDPKTGARYYAVVQLRRDDRNDTLYNMVGFQTRLKFGEQKRVFGLIPGLEHAEFARNGVMHKNTYIDSPKILDGTYKVVKKEIGGSRNVSVFFAGQITGVEGYIESCSSGLVAGINACCAVKGLEPFVLPQTTQTGALAAYASGYSGEDFQPMGANFGIMVPVFSPEDAKIRDKKRRRELISRQALNDVNTIKTDRSDLF